MLRAATQPARHRCEQCNHPGEALARCTRCDGTCIDPEDPEAAAWLERVRGTEKQRRRQRIALQPLGVLVILWLLISGGLDWSVWGPRAINLTASVPGLEASTARMADGSNLTVDWSGRDFTGQSFADVTFQGSTLNGAGLTSTFWARPKVWESQLSSADLRDSRLIDADFRSSIMRDADLSESFISGTHFTGVDLSNADFSGARLEDVSFWVETMLQADFSGATLRDVTFGGIDLRHANFSGTDLTATRFHRQYRGRVTDLSRADFRCANLTGVSLAGIPMDGADLRGAALAETDLTQEQLDSVHLGFLDCAMLPR